LVAYQDLGLDPRISVGKDVDEFSPTVGQDLADQQTPMAIIWLAATAHDGKASLLCPVQYPVDPLFE
jgi:hypothetical protein